MLDTCRQRDILRCQRKFCLSRSQRNCHGYLFLIHIYVRHCKGLTTGVVFSFFFINFYFLLLLFNSQPSMLLKQKLYTTTDSHKQQHKLIKLVSLYYDKLLFIFKYTHPLRAIRVKYNVYYKTLVVRLFFYLFFFGCWICLNSKNTKKNKKR